MSKAQDAGGNEYTFEAFMALKQMQRQGLGWEDIAIRMRERGHQLRPEQIKAIVLGKRHVHHKP